MSGCKHSQSGGSGIVIRVQSVRTPWLLMLDWCLGRMSAGSFQRHHIINDIICRMHKFHFTETALFKLTNDILETIDSGKITILTALDISAAFDTLDHITLLHRLQHTFGLSGYVISWIRSYLTDRSSFVKIDSSSSPSTILTGVPQGSVLGPLLFVLFISPIANVINPDQSNQNNTVSWSILLMTLGFI